VWIASYCGVAVPLDNNYDNFSFSDTLLFCLSPNMALFIGIRVISSFEFARNFLPLVVISVFLLSKKNNCVLAYSFSGDGQQWRNIGTPLGSNEMSLGIVVLMLLVGSFINVILAMYFEKVLPSKYGVRKPWYFIFQVNPNPILFEV